MPAVERYDQREAHLAANMIQIVALLHFSMSDAF